MAEQDGGLGGARDAGGLAALISRAAHAGAALPPVERWDPPDCGAIPMEIRADGTWFYNGTPIGRPALVRLFSTVLRREEDGRHVLVTPVEKVTIAVEDAPFLAVEVDASGTGEDRVLTFRTNVGDAVEAGPDHPMRFTGAADELKPYVRVRGPADRPLEALASRPVMYELVEHGEEIAVDGRAMFALRSRGAVFPVMPMGDLDRLARG